MKELEQWRAWGRGLGQYKRPEGVILFLNSSWNIFTLGQLSSTYIDLEASL